MKEQNNGSEFTIGLDLGERRHRFCALNGKGEVVEEATVGNERASLARLTRALPRGAGRDGSWSAQPLDQSISGRAGLVGDCVQSARCGRFISGNARAIGATR